MNSLQSLHQSTMNMSRASKIISLAAVAFALISCGGSDKGVADKAAIDGTLMASPSSEVVIGMLDVNRMVILDTLMTDEAGKFSYELEVSKGDPEFVYVYREGSKVASLLLDAGDAVSFTVDADGVISVEGSEESEKLMQVEKEQAEMNAMFAELSAEYESASKARADEIVEMMTKEYRDYNRNSVKYVMENSHSLTVVPVLYRKLGELPLFTMTTDAVLFSSIADSLALTYPDSRYAKALKNEADARFAELELASRMKDAEVVGYLDVELPGLDGKIKKLSDIDSKVVLLYFWTAADPQQNMFNVEVLKKLYNDYHHRGFDIYQVSLDVDKVQWATTVMGQNLPWTNVCDIRGAASEYVTLYNLLYQTEDGNIGIAVPAAFVINDGELVDGEIVDEASFRKLLEKLL